MRHRVSYFKMILHLHKGRRKHAVYTRDSYTEDFCLTFFVCVYFFLSSFVYFVVVWLLFGEGFSCGDSSITEKTTYF